jgi:hypothetical protein
MSMVTALFKLQAHGVLDAPLGRLTVAFLRLPGLREIRAWHVPTADTVLDTFARITMQSLLHHDGYLVRAAGRACLWWQAS